MSRQVGIVLGVSMLIAVLGTPAGAHQAQAAFVHGWWTIAGVSLLGALTALGMTPRPAPALAGTAAPARPRHAHRS
jgi:hypothetical protein